MLYRSVQLTLVSSAGDPPKAIAGQTVEIVSEPDIVLTGVDGIRSYARQPSKIVWLEGKARDLTTITSVKIAKSDGEELVDGWDIITNPGAPRDVAKGVQFFVLRPDIP